MRMCLSGVLAALAVGFGSYAEGRDEEKIDVKKLVGKWTMDEEKGKTVVLEFTKDGKVKVAEKEKDKKDMVLSGTYKVDGAKLTVTFKAGDKEFSETLTVVSLDDDELVMKDSKGKKDTFERVEEDK